MAGGIPEYDELKLRVESGDDGYRVVAFGPDGATATGHFAIPMSKMELDNFVLRMTRAGGPVRAYRSSQMEEAKQLGGALFDQLMADDVGEIYHGARRVADSRGRGLRIALYMTGAPELLEIPWELLYDRGEAYFLSQSIYTPVVRALDLKSPPAAPPTVTLPLQVLALVSAPEGFPPLDVAAERAKLEQALAPLTDSGAVRLEWLESATLSELDRRIGAPDELHVIHYIGHGAYDERTQGGILVLEDARGGPHEVTGEELGGFMRDEKSLRLAVLNSCEGARSSHVDPFSGVASALLRCGLPAVVGMQAEITDEAAVTFSDRLYSALAQGFPIDAALAQARRAIFAAGRDVEFGTPVLFMRVSDGRIFQVTGPAPPPPAGRLEADLRAEPELVTAGGTVAWRLEVRNAGQSTLSEVTVRDKAGDTREGPFSLKAGEARECSWTATVERDVDEAAAVGGRGSDGRLVSTEASAHVRVEPRRRDERNWRLIAAIGAAGLILVAVLLIATGGGGGGGGGGSKPHFTPFPTGTDVVDLDARGDKVAFVAAASDSPDQSELFRLDLGGGSNAPVGPVAASYNGIDVGRDANDHARLVYSHCDGVCHIYTKPFRGQQETPVSVFTEECSDTRPNMWEGLILFARGGAACGQHGLVLKRPGSSDLVPGTAGSAGADVNDGRLAWLASNHRTLMARGVTTDGKLTPAGSRDAPGGEAFKPPLVIEDDYVYFVHQQASQDFIARARLPLDGSRIEHYVQSKNDNGAEEAPHFGVTGNTLYITNYPKRNGGSGSRMVMQVRNPTFKPVG